MYWFLNGQPMSILPFLLAGVLWVGGGWLISVGLFRLGSSERVAVGAAFGLALHLTISNLLVRIAPPAAAFTCSAILVACVGLAFGFRVVRRSDLRELLGNWPQVLAWALMAFTIVQMGRGLAILDDRKNLSLISLMATGHVPPPFYMDASVPFKYHYGAQLLGADLMAQGGLTPWSAYDVSKGLVGGLAILLSWHLGRRLTHRAWGGYAMAGLVTLGSGARWLLLLAPPSWITAAGETVRMWGSGAETAARLGPALASDWVLSGGPPAGIPFAFLSGMNEPFILGIQSASVALSRAMVFMLLLTLRRERSPWAAVAWTSAFALLALTWETDFLLYGAALLLLLGWIALRWGRRAPGRAWVLAIVSVLAAGVISAVQGGTLTEVARGLLSFKTGVDAGTMGLNLRWPPALVSAQLGLLRLDRPAELLVGLAEAGWPLLAVPLTLVFLRRSALRRYEIAAFALSSYVAAVIPPLVEYTVDRDVSRFSSYALSAWTLLAVPAFFLLARRRRAGWVARLGIGWGTLSVLGGAVIFGALLTAAGRSVFSEAIDPIDAAMARRVWGTLAAGEKVIDSHPYRAVIVTGLPTQSTHTDFSPNAAWSDLVADPRPKAMAAAGFRYAYVDSWWWASMSPGNRAAFTAGCPRLVASSLDKGENPERWLYDLGACR